jgi:hypothetical protein
MKNKIRLTPLEAAAYELAGEVWDGKWDHVPEVKTRPIDEWTAIPAELERRCPGYSTDQYVRTVAKGMMCYH